MYEFEDFVEKSLEVANLEELGAIFLSVLQDEGFENFALAEVTAFKLKRVLLSHFPQGYLSYYRDQKWDRIDPVINLSVRSTRAFCWADALPRDLPKKQRDFLAECEQLGVHSGVTIPFHSPDRRVDLISLSRRTHEPQHRKRLSHLYAISAQVWQRSLDFEAKDARAVAGSIPRLSAREVECLAWSRDGVSYNEIAERLNISHRTVEYHMYSAMRKLDARDKITAVVKAIHYGLI